MRKSTYSFSLALPKLPVSSGCELEFFVIVLVGLEHGQSKTLHLVMANEKL